MWTEPEPAPSTSRSAEALWGRYIRPHGLPGLARLQREAPSTSPLSDVAPAPRTTREEPMNVIVGYRPTPEGSAALDRAVDVARRFGARLIVVNSAEQPSESPEPISLERGVDALSERLVAEGLAHDIR